ncbi:PAM68 family protein [Planktothrix sp. FACHB-1355]|uniref:PAM68 family protein n=1 Tax=Aerosakkonema funiforme FACHB-1375 TaxID=2949571 RepID=A0A926VHM2_9CYAN|nr:MULTISPECIES: PAM68 family protein [Oscillatoriales]MBD2183947.1 PAM68 family protein [Aerosakkonema funiforme FACHB-1375]MBD3561508.1 PAM68 family protein [Planktothrix sp. FACHB-1355]
MPSEPQQESSSGKKRLPFEPKKNSKKATKTSSATPIAAKTEDKPRSVSKENKAIPEAVSQRMVKRMAFFCGIPTSLGISTFILSYIVVSHAWFTLPTPVVVLTSMGFFGLGVLGLSYGVLSASWEEETPGSIFGWEQFTVNWGRMTAAWRSGKQKN